MNTTKKMMKNKKTTFLAIETSCDDTSVAILQGQGEKTKILANVISSQIDMHQKYGGVVPNLAARLHLQNLNFCLKKAKEKAKISWQEIDAIAVTQGPGLIPALFIGSEAAKSLSWALNKPLFGINHLEGHLYANWAEPPFPLFPALGLLVSGGHTNLILLKDHFHYKMLGETLDDAVGECFDKIARFLGLPYPGGPELEKLAADYKGELIDFPRPLLQKKNYCFSYSGLKTAVYYYLKEQKKLTLPLKRKIAASFQEAALSVLIEKTKRAAQEFPVKSVLLAGGVSANKTLRQRLEKEMKKLNKPLFLPPLSLTTDNAAMIALAAYYRQQKNYPPLSWKNFKVKADLSL